MHYLPFAVALSCAAVQPAWAVEGIASWYDCKQKGECSPNKITASGEKFDPQRLALALPNGKLPRWVCVTHAGRMVRLWANDRGPAKRLGRVADLTPASKAALGIKGGLARVKVKDC